MIGRCQLSASAALWRKTERTEMMVAFIIRRVFGFEFELIMRRPSNINYLECRLSLNQLGSVERRDSIYSRSRTPVPDDVFLGPFCLELANLNYSRDSVKAQYSLERG